MQRLPDWRSRLFQTISSFERKPFEYGSHDCALFGASIVEALTGIDLAEQFRGEYRTKTGGLRAIRKAGYDDQFDFIAKHFDEVPTAFAQVGDLGLIESDDDAQAIVVILGSQAAGVGPDGLVRFNISQIKKSFKVGGQ